MRHLHSLEQRTITYDRDALLSIRNSALSQQTPDLPPIPGVTVPKMKEKKDMPESLRQKLLKRGKKNCAIKMYI